MKNFALAVMLLLLASQAHAQFGVKAGVNESVLTGRAGEDASYKTYFHAGVFYEYKIFGPISIQPEVLYSMQGAAMKGTSAATNTDYTTQLQYITVPILIKATFGPVFVEVGPQFGRLLYANEDGRVQTRSSSGTVLFGEVNQKSTDNYKPSDYSLCAGVGLKLAPSARVGVRFVAGLNDINNIQFLQGVTDLRQQNQVFQLYAAFQLPKL
ncbi:porin family protein [Hymenobacter baengnokdamensis]|uniref:porin family protein n=1 Tax=Hymenobacter baengnokdamensis TaxID=2615203 RepID=UPI001244DAF5|nr:porin family protein [Hymenobacter baengnokdamensis]